MEAEIMSNPPDEKDLWVASLLGIDCTQECDGALLDIDGDWQCGKCGTYGYDWDETTHTIEPRSYTRSIGAAWQFLQFMINHPSQKVTQEFTGALHRSTSEDGDFCFLIELSDRDAAYAIYLAARVALGVEQIDNVFNAVLKRGRE
jgi:hypothetical protein